MFNSAPAVGLDITSAQLTAVALKKRGKVYSVDSTAVAGIEHGIVVDGEVHDVDRLANAIRELWASSGIKSKTVNLGVSNQRCITRILTFPKISKKNLLHNAVRIEAMEHLPIPLEDAVWDYHVFEEFVDPEMGGTKQRIVLVMVYRESVERYRDAVEKAGLTLNRIDLAAFALMRAGLAGLPAFADLHAGDSREQAVALCDIGPTMTNVVISRSGACEMNRIVSVGTQAFTETLVEQFQWGRDDAERVRFEAGVTPLGGTESPGDPYTDSRRIMQFVADQLAHELRTSFEYFQHSNAGSYVGRVVLSGEGALLRGIEERFASTLGLPVSILDASVHLDPRSVEALGGTHAHLGVALGLSMEEAA